MEAVAAAADELKISKKAPIAAGVKLRTTTASVHVRTNPPRTLSSRRTDQRRMRRSLFLLRWTKRVMMTMMTMMTNKKEGSCTRTLISILSPKLVLNQANFPCKKSAMRDHSQRRSKDNNANI
jgi:hypothetical protein